MSEEPSSKELRLLYLKMGDRKPEVQVNWDSWSPKDLEAYMNIANLVFAYLYLPVRDPKKK